MKTHETVGSTPTTSELPDEQVDEEFQKIVEGYYNNLRPETEASPLATEAETEEMDFEEDDLEGEESHALADDEIDNSSDTYGGALGALPEVGGGGITAETKRDSNEPSFLRTIGEIAMSGLGFRRP